MEKINLLTLNKLCESDPKLRHKLQEWGLLPKEGEYLCEKCSTPLSLTRYEQSVDRLRWVCPGKVSLRKQKKRPCGNVVSYRKGTFFERSHLSLLQILAFVDFWVDNAPLKLVSKHLDISIQCAVDWASFCREVVLDAMYTNREKLGGPGVTVEIDESKFGHRKFHRGHRVEGQWVFGGFERDTGRVFMVTVEERGADTLVPLVREWIKEGTTVVSDFWGAYNCLDREGYTHLKVNHSINFKDPKTGAHTNHIEATWRAAKAATGGAGRKKCHIPGNLARYMFFKRCHLLQLNRTLEFYRLAGMLYNPVNPVEDIIRHVADDVVQDVEDEDEVDIFRDLE